MTTEDQITSIAGLLSGLALTSPARAVPIYTQYTSSPSSYPYLFISDDSVSYQDIDFQTYKVLRRYKLSIVAEFEPNQVDARVAESQLRELLNKTEDLIKTKASRNNGWQDIKLIFTSQPFNGSEVAFESNTVIREITVEVEDTESV
jgi:hypothetical protein